MISIHMENVTVIDRYGGNKEAGFGGFLPVSDRAVSQPGGRDY